MKIRVKEKEELTEIEIEIYCKIIDEKVKKLINRLQVLDKKIVAVRENQTYFVHAFDILYIDTVDKRTFFYTSDNIFETSMKLYELEEELEDCDFFRGGKSIIINCSHIVKLKPDFNGRIQVTMSNGEKLMISRQYAKQIKRKLEGD